MATIGGGSPERYDAAAARHYAAYRPPLHALILSRALPPGAAWPCGLDVGCGTGYSAIALAKYCERVVGVDPSEAMLGAAQPHPHVRYVRGAGDALGRTPGAPFDIVTFAGSLYYCKSLPLRRELALACRGGGTVVVYDFELRLGEALAELGVVEAPVASGYDHAVNLADWAEFGSELVGAERVHLEVAAEQMAHLVLSDSNRLDMLRKRGGATDPFPGLHRELRERHPRWKLPADVWFARYRALR